jgi:hypothetical protein
VKDNLFSVNSVISVAKRFRDENTVMLRGRPETVTATGRYDLNGGSPPWREAPGQAKGKRRKESNLATEFTETKKSVNGES